MLLTWKGRALLNPHISCHHQAQVLPGYDWLFQVNPSHPELEGGRERVTTRVQEMTAQRRLSFLSPMQAAAGLSFPREKGMIITNITSMDSWSSECQDIHDLQWLLAQHIKALHFLFNTKANLCSTLGSMLIQSHWLTLSILLNILLTKNHKPYILTTATAFIIILNRPYWDSRLEIAQTNNKGKACSTKQRLYSSGRKQERDRKKQRETAERYCSQENRHQQ